MSSKRWACACRVLSIGRIGRVEGTAKWLLGEIERAELAGEDRELRVLMRNLLDLTRHGDGYGAEGGVKLDPRAFVAGMRVASRAIEFVPDRLREVGLKDAPWSVPCGDTVDGLQRRPVGKAYERYKLVGLATPRSLPAIVIWNPVRNPAAAGLPSPSFTVAGDWGRCAVWTIPRPVLQGWEARSAPIELYGAASEAMARALSGTGAPLGLISGDPTFPGSWGVEWGSDDAQDLGGLLRCLPQLHRTDEPMRQAITEGGRRRFLHALCAGWVLRRPTWQELRALPVSDAVGRVVAEGTERALTWYGVEYRGLGRDAGEYSSRLLFDRSEEDWARGMSARQSRVAKLRNWTAAEGATLAAGGLTARQTRSSERRAKAREYEAAGESPAQIAYYLKVSVRTAYRYLGGVV